MKDGQGTGLTTNADMGPTQVRDHCPVDETGRQLLGAAMRQMQLSARPLSATASSSSAVPSPIWLKGATLAPLPRPAVSP